MPIGWLYDPRIPIIWKTLGNPYRNEWVVQVILVGGWTNPFEKCARQIGSFPQVGMKITNIWNHHPVCHMFEKKKLKIIAWEAEDYENPISRQSIIRKKKVIRDTTMKSNGWNLKIIQLTKENYLPNLRFWVQNMLNVLDVYSCSVGSRKGFFLTHQMFQLEENCVSYKFKDILHITHPFVEFLGHHK